MPTGQDCFIRMRVVQLRRRGRSAIEPGCVDTASAFGDFGDFDPPFNREGPVALCVRAIGTCYVEELGAVLSERALAWRAIRLQLDAACMPDSLARRLDAVAVSSTILGGDPRMHSQYAAAARRARDQSAVGRTSRGNVVYKVGVVTIVADDACHVFTPCNVSDVGPVGAFPDALFTLATRHLAAFSRHRHDKMVAMLDPGGVLEDVACGSRLKGRAIVGSYYRNWWDAFGLRLADAQCRCAGTDTIAVEAHCIGTHAGTFGGIVPTGGQIDLRFAAMLRFRDGFMVDARIYYDVASLHHQLGIAADAPKPITRGDFQ